MQDSSWQQLKDLFNEALAYPEEERIAFVERTCTDQELKAEILSLLAYHEEDSAFLEESVDVETLRVVEQESHKHAEGTLIGPYRIERILGQGGMGTVFLAERVDGQFEQKVAIKLGNRDVYDRDLQARLQRERQILASLVHPHIARLLDGGVTSDGRPYFAMEYVAGGIPIDQYCVDNNVTLPQRLRLFQDACAAVAHAHRQLIVHRDLKPSNILVTPEGTVKLLDFGVAKLMEEGQNAHAPLTRTGLLIMTPEYASPEQVKGEAISTSSDIYSLGVILFELIAGKRPYEVRGLAPTQVEQIVCNTDPVKPSTAILEVNLEDGAPSAQAIAFQRQAKGDLDNIVMMALRKEPAARYGSVDQLKEDIDRYLAQLPISARPATVRYRVAKFVGRHKAGVAAMLLILVALLGGIIATSYQANVAMRARENAEQRTEDVRDMANTLMFDIHDAIRDLPGATPARRLLVKNAEQYLSTLSEDLSADPALQVELAEAYNRVGEIQGDPHYPNLGDMDGATEYYKKALDLRETLWQRDTGSVDLKRALAIAQSRLAVLLSWGGSNEEAIQLSREAIQLLETVYEKNKQVDVKHDLGRIRSELGWWYVFAGQMTEARLHLDLAREELEAVAEIKAGDVDFEIDLWRVYNYLVDAYRWGGDPDLALNMLEETACTRLEMMDSRLVFNPRVKSCLRTCLNKLGDLYQRREAYDEAIIHYKASLSIAESLAGSDSTNALATGGVATIQSAIGALYKELGRTEEALFFLNQAKALKEKLYNGDPTNGEMGNTYANTLRSVCSYYLDAGQPSLALPSCEKSIQVFEIAIAADTLNGIWRSNLVETYLVLATVHQALGEKAAQHEARVRHYRDAIGKYDNGILLIQKLESEGTAFTWPAQLDSLQSVRANLEKQVDR